MIESTIITLLRHLHAFNKLDSITIKLLEKIFKVDVEKICRIEGITYDISPPPKRLLARLPKKQYEVVMSTLISRKAHLLVFLKELQAINKSKICTPKTIELFEEEIKVIEELTN